MSVIVLGGGLGGLSACHYILKSLKNNVSLIEKSDSLGGWVKSITDPLTGVILEKGPHTVRAKGKLGRNSLRLLEDLNLSSKVKSVTGDHPAASKRLIYAHNKLHYLPSNVSSMFKTMSPFSKPLIFGGLKLLFSPTKVCHDESIYDFTCRKFGKEIADYLISPMICGICAGNSKDISVNFLMAPLFEAEQKHGSIMKGLWKEKFFSSGNDSEEYSPLCETAKRENWTIWNLEGGLGTLVMELENSVKEKGGNIITNTTIDEITFEKSEVICSAKGIHHKCSHVVSALPAKSLGKLISKQHPELANKLCAIPFVSVVVVNLIYNGTLLKHNAFGFLVPPAEKLPLLGVIFDSCIFPQKNKTVLTAMIGGSWFLEHLGRNPSQETILNSTLVNLDKILGISENPESYSISILEDCIPQYVVGHRNRISKIYEYINSRNLPLYLVGSSYDGVGINDVISSAKNVVDKIKR